MIITDNMKFTSPAESYNILIGLVMNNGDEVSPRGKLTRESCALNIAFDDPTDNYIVGEEHADFIESEVRTVKNGDSPEQKAPQELIDRLDLEEDGTFFEGGIRRAIGQNWDVWVNRFDNAPDTRKNCATFTRPGDTDPPCTISIQFLLRDNEMHLVTFNRSQDLMFAYPMDCALFGSLLEDMADEVGVDVGRWFHMMGSAHIYEDDFDEANDIAWANE